MYKLEEANHFEPLEFGKTTVYMRKEPTYFVRDKKATEREFLAVKEDRRVTYLEKQLTYHEYYAEIEAENKQLRTQVKALTDSIDFTNDVMDELIVATLKTGGE